MPQNQRTKISSYRREDQASTGHGLIAAGIVSQVTVDCDERTEGIVHVVRAAAVQLEDTPLPS